MSKVRYSTYYHLSKLVGDGNKNIPKRKAFINFNVQRNKTFPYPGLRSINKWQYLGS